MQHLVLLRHGESLWNEADRFTGWTDVGLTPRGIEEAVAAGQRLCQAGFVFDVAYTSVLKRAIKTLWLVLETMDLMWIPVYASWRLNERHYGALQGLDKAEVAAQYGEEQTTLWRRSYDVRPPALPPGDPRDPGTDRRYAALRPEALPRTESLRDTTARLLPYWHDAIAPALRRRERVLIVAHGNSLRALVKYLDDIPDAEVSALYIPTGVPLVYTLADDLSPLRRDYLEAPAALGHAAQTVVPRGPQA